MKKINRKWEQIIVQKTTDHHHTTRSGDTMNPNKKKERICINLKISVISVICMVIGLALVERQNILQVYIKPLQKQNTLETNFIHKDNFKSHNFYLDISDFFENLYKTDNILSGGILRDD